MLKPKTSKKLSYIITGTGRCGTVFMANFFNSIGIKCSHEGIFNKDMGLVGAKGRIAEGFHNSKTSTREGLPDVMVDVAAESSMFAAPFLESELLKGIDLIHLVRHPLKVITSFVLDLKMFGRPDTPAVHRFVENSIIPYLPGINDYTEPFLRCCYYYVEWNEKIEKSAQNRRYMLHRIEDNLDKVFDFINVPPTTIRYADDKCNSFAKRHDKSEVIKWTDIPESPIKQKIMEISRRFGYE